MAEVHSFGYFPSSSFQVARCFVVSAVTPGGWAAKERIGVGNAARHTFFGGGVEGILSHKLLIHPNLF